MFPLENAETKQGLRRIAIDPVTRVEGHGKVTLLLDDDNHVHQARLHIVEFRGFEAFIEGRPYWEVPVTVQRLCGICPVSHQLAAVKAMDLIAGYERLTPTAEKLRRLMHYGQILQSHAVHFFHLASPDLLLGFDSEPTKRNILGVAAQFPDIAKQGIFLRKYGQEVIRHVSGKRIHGVGAIPGGVSKALTDVERDELRRDVDTMIQWARDAVRLVARIHTTHPEFYDSFGEFRASMMSLVGPDGALELYDGALRARDADGGLIFDGAPCASYNEFLQEEVKSWTYMKFPHIRALGAEAGWYRVGPLARVQTCDFIATPLAEAERKNFLAAGGGKPRHGTLLYHWARMIEALHAAETIRDLLDDVEIVGTDLIGEKGERREEAVGVIEAPRGTLIHHYRVGADDLVKYCNLIVSTTNNNQAMNEAVRSVARSFIDGNEVTEGLLNHIEVAIRAYDPCLSCATHAIGQMPLQVDLVDSSGALVSRRAKNFSAA
ncbi:Ni/Fe hydrogenase subunit alpha [Rhodoblastus acidophilus]|uniref:Ni/Fe hydrogenase subunit alpha n=1 Tax=Candidatus Rhodoblastus alkanivorans TaxID=2954117 RepID=A0ABS9ZA60_9HYPH|nr:Ni/Fe hydrogenase subunit alpha [Candidatus Rhodoblastus alkanivorans]MCI4680018.1 Ni/Fe hydrogenase subunit alpha [Candidatus Rhodoblastus alkanivorans]MCI4684240.1 Ni/Fe hydrogenase subunit alpha [Candidatus Rhodoblastus alkanivorans]MDI4641560.1 Ni/Fe hydrogenase subunit alpha [Rhodoblastus acidophilus]